MGGMVVDNFAGGGGATSGIEEAIGRPVDLAVNHSRAAVAMHRANHPATHHACQDIWTVDPKTACGGRRGDRRAPAWWDAFIDRHAIPRVKRAEAGAA